MAVWLDHLKRGGKSRRKPVFSFLGDTLRTRVYVDGYNLYYGCLKGTPFKWLNPLSLFERILPTVTATIDQHGALTSELDPLSVKFFTAPILEKAAKAEDSLRCQEKYHKALNKHLQGRIEIVNGYYSLTAARAKVIDSQDPKKWPRDCVETPIWKLEEKQSDVNLSLQAVVDALVSGIEHVVIVTNDTDIEPALKMIRAHTKAAVGLIIPTTDHQRQPNTSLAQHAHWVRSHITAGELQASQLPFVIPDGKKTAISKPESWYARPDLLARALELGTAHYGNRAQAFKWLTRPNKFYEERTPLDLLENGDARVLQFMEEMALPTVGDGS
ncbi:6-hydroxy-3-succinoylpyridine hydroxylase [Acidovorax sp. LjRoot129]|uniref:NYN domain-containing protein n=1 Tax=Acidovorax sp. LjRoot129 TaxID=3342260 RepID=UPI003ECF5D85